MNWKLELNCSFPWRLLSSMEHASWAKHFLQLKKRTCNDTFYPPWHFGLSLKEERCDWMHSLEVWGWRPDRNWGVKTFFKRNQLSLLGQIPRMETDATGRRNCPVETCGSREEKAKKCRYILSGTTNISSINHKVVLDPADNGNCLC